MNFKEWLSSMEEGVYCKKGACGYGGTVPTPSNRKPEMKVPTPKTAKIMRPHDKIHMYSAGGGPVSGGGGGAPAGGGGGISAPVIGGAPSVGGGAPSRAATR